MLNESFDYQGLRRDLADAAAEGVWLGTSSWKYAGWFGTVYDEQRYIHRGKVSEKRFEQHCLSEYAELFPTVCVDAAYYQFPTADRLRALATQVKPGFRFTFKVTDDITIKRFPNLPRHGARAGKLNPHFLDADLFLTSFLEPCRAIRDFMGMMIFEFSPFHPGDFARGREFMEALDGFLTRLPRGWDYGVEIRNPAFLHPDYFSMLASHEVSHVYNSWAGMPSVADQVALPGSLTRPECVGARLLLKPGRKYQEAVDSFQPYQEIREPLPAVRSAVADLIRRRRKSPRTRSYLYVNNRLEGNAPRTIAEIFALTKAAGNDGG